MLTKQKAIEFSRYLPGRASVNILIGCLIYSLGSFSALQAADAPVSFYDDFESADTHAWDYTGLWGRSSDISVHYAGGGAGYVVSATAEGARERVGKAYLTKDMRPVFRGDRIEASMLLYVPYQTPSDGSVYLLDIECRDCGYEEKPGLRVLVDKNGMLRVNRSKLGLQEDFFAISDDRIPFNRAFTLTVILELGGDGDGRTLVYVDQELVIDSVGVNMPLNSVTEPLGVALTAERFDYVQFGVTANSRPDSINLSFDDAEIHVFSNLQ